MIYKYIFIIAIIFGIILAIARIPSPKTTDYKPANNSFGIDIKNIKGISK